MRTTIAHWTKYSLIACVICTTQVGCKSGWKMPGSGMLPWSKKPSEATLAGSTPSITVPGSTSPGSSPSGGTGSALAASGGAAGSGPASKNTPNLLSSTPKTSPYSGATPTGGAKPNNAGAVASANGYQTGPYMTSTGNRPTGYTAPSGYANASTPQMPGATPSTGSPMLPGAAPMAGLASNPAALPSTSPSLPLPPSPFPAAPAGLGAPSNSALASTVPGQLPNLPPSNFPTLPSTVPAQPVSTSSAAMPGLPPMNSGMAAMPSSPAPTTMPNMGGLPALPGPATTALPAPPPAASPTAAPMYAGAAPYQPGSTARQTNYNFSQPSTSPVGVPGAGVPQTANGIPVPGNSVYR